MCSEGSFAMTPEEQAWEKLQQNWTLAWIGGRKHWVHKRRLHALCDRDLTARGLNLPLQGEKERLCHDCDHKARLLRRDYAAKIAKTYQMTLTFPEETA